ncbi:MAG TPA: ABC transporter ATP-binding protein [Anaerolineaceae bacterium]|nr:ABC transporter ATP-binding protein [Anaerolineaceae bacterium]HPN51347.1 ABC transporter ATP-binding protein [Anaerolineaceae bacterium]
MQAVSAVRVENLGRDFGTLSALNGLSFEIPQGIVFGYLGPNGSGKTTTIRVLLGLLEPTRGRAEVLGLDTRSGADGIRERCGALLEHTGLYERLNAEDNLEFYGRVWRMSAGERSARIKELLSGLGLWERRKEQVGSWSRGMKQKLAIARAILHRPQLVFLDEPTAGLDPLAAAALRDDLAQLASLQGVTVFLTTHNLAEAEKLCSQVAVIRKGQLLKIGSPDELRMASGAPRLEIVGRNFSPAALEALRGHPLVSGLEQHDHHLTLDLKDKNTDTSPLIQLMVTQGVQIDEVRKGQASLEETFLTLMEEEDHD